MRINKNDQVLVLTGGNSGKRSRVLSVDKEKGKVTVEGVNVGKKHIRRSKKNPQGGILSMERPVDISNVQVVCPICGKPTRVGARFDAEGAKYRVCKKCGKDINRISPAKKKK
ncbi:MAG: 50S ribosomal protein L24 [Planctomycetaceae bacterium]|nr:50S ribosomal protein L24 [Planctomycetaceae bacterium]